MRKCQLCQKENTEDAQFCNHCGKPLSFEAISRPQDVSPPVKISKVLLYAGTVFFGFIILVSIITSLQEGASKIWTEQELKQLEGKSVKEITQLLGSSWYEGQGLGRSTFLKWNVPVQSRNDGSVFTQDVTIDFLDGVAIKVNIYGGLRR